MRLPILLLHSLDYKRAPTSFPPHLFLEMLDGLQSAGFQTLDLERAVAGLRTGSLEPRSLCVTFDDGCSSVYEAGFEPMLERGFTATLYVIARHADWSVLRQMHKQGFQIGSHTLTHADLRGLDYDRLKDEIVGSQREIEDRLGAEVTTFAYPYGRYDKRALELVRCHYQTACSSRLGLADKRSDPHLLERVETYYLRGKRLVRLINSPLLEPYLRLRAVPRAFKQVLE